MNLSDVRDAALTAAAVFAATLFAGIPAKAAESDPAPLATLSAERQIELAMSAAPPEVAQRAAIYVLGLKGYVQARDGTNGFTCLVERQYLETLEPQCYDAEGSATTLQARLYREQLRAAEVGEAEIEKRIAARYKAGTLKAPRKPGLGLATLINLLNPSRLVLAGGTLRYPGYAEAALQAARRFALPQLAGACSIELATDGETLVARGAARSSDGLTCR